jgi:hypothetical protein
MVGLGEEDERERCGMNALVRERSFAWATFPAYALRTIALVIGSCTGFE